MSPTLTAYEREQLAAVEAGEMPLAVYADWLEENGDERSVGARWLADHGKWPRRLGVGWWWPNLEGEPIAGLPPSVRARMPRTLEPFPSFPDALFSAVNAATDQVKSSPIDERAELIKLWGAPGAGGVARIGFANWLRIHELPLARGIWWLASLSARPGCDLDRGERWWVLGNRDGDVTWPINSILPQSVFDRCLEGWRSTGELQITVRRYSDLETALHDAARAVEEALDAGEIRDVPRGR